MARAQLALGTAQFGLAYGIAGRDTPIPDREARAILKRAWTLGIERIDTAAAYGDVEKRLASLAGDIPFTIVTKIPPLPQGGEEIARAHVRAWVARSRRRLGERLAGILFHEAMDLLGPYAATAWQEVAAAGLPAGPSCYDGVTLTAIARTHPVRMAQLPGNALDQSVAGLDPNRIEITLRSLFLQGILLMPQDQAAARLPAAGVALRRWHAFCRERELPPLHAALSVAKALPNAAFCVVGVDSEAQLEEIAAAWAEVDPLNAPQLDTPDPLIIDPRRWDRAR